MMLVRLWNLLVFTAWLIGPFVLVGTVRWGAGWGYLVPLALAVVFHHVYVVRTNPELARHRRGIGAGSKKWDVVWNIVFWPLMACAPLAAGFGARVGTSPMPWALWPVGLGLLAAGFALSGRAMAVNPHFEGTVRLQAERSHRVVDAGPYRFVRHPGYVGLILWAAATPFLLRSGVALVPAAVASAWIVLRTRLEDSLLRRELPGYIEYARRVPFRLIPGVW